MEFNIVFISSRQLGQVEFGTYPLKEATLHLILSKEEKVNLPNEISAEFESVTEISVNKNDGVIAEYDQQSVIAAVQRVIQPNKKNALVCFDEGNVAVSDAARCQFKLTNQAHTNIELFRNKLKMKQAVKAAGLKTPDFISLENPDMIEFENLKELLDIPFVIKPVDSAGSNDVYVIKDEEQLSRAQKRIIGLDTVFEAESFIDGALYHCDIALFNREVVFQECTEYLASTIEFQSGTPLGGQYVGPTRAIRNTLIEFARKGLNALQAGDGVYHMEIFVNKNAEPVFLECAARPPGMLVTKMYHKATGVNLLNLDVSIQLGRVRTEKKGQLTNSAFYLVYPKGTGVVSRLHPQPTIPNEIQVEFKYSTKLGDIHRGCRSNIDYTSTVVASASDFKALDQYYAQMAKFIPLSYLSEVSEIAMQPTPSGRVVVTT